MITWIVILIVSAVLFVATVVAVYARIFNKPNSSVSSMDRGVKRFVTEKGHGILYEVNPRYRNFVHKYVIYREGDVTKLLCSINRNLSYLDYSVIAFGYNHKVLRIINRKNFLNGNKYTKWMVLPDGTAYVSVVVNRADNREFEHKTGVYLKNGRIAFASIFAFLATASEAFAISYCLSNLLGGLFRESYISSAVNWIIIVGSALIVGTLMTLIIVYHSKRMKRMG